MLGNAEFKKGIEFNEEDPQIVSKRNRDIQRVELNSFNGKSFEHLNIPPKNNERFKTILQKVINMYKEGGFSFEKENTFSVGSDIYSKLAPTLLGGNDILLNVDGAIDKVWFTEELTQSLLSKNKEPITKKQVEDFCNFLNTLIKIQ